jgi:lysozyme
VSSLDDLIHRIPDLTDDVDFKRAELLLKAKENDIKEQGLNLQIKERREFWRSPVIISIAVGSIGLFGNIWATLYSGHSQRTLEDVRRSSQLVIESVKTADPEKAYKMLSFLKNQKLIEIDLQLLEKDPSQTPFLPTAQAAIPPTISELRKVTITGTNCDDFNISRRSASDSRPIEGFELNRSVKMEDWSGLGNMSFVFIRVSQGGSLVDSSFSLYWTKASEAKLVRSPYHYFSLNIPAEAQAANFLNVLAAFDYGKCDLPPALVLAEPLTREGVQDPALLVTQAVTWMELIGKQVKRKPLLYLHSNVLSRLGNEASRLTEYPLMFARLGPQQQVPAPRPWTSLLFRAYTEELSLPGNSGKFEGFRFQGNRDELIALATPVRN